MSTWEGYEFITLSNGRRVIGAPIVVPSTPPGGCDCAAELAPILARLVALEAVIAGTVATEPEVADAIAAAWNTPPTIDSVAVAVDSLTATTTVAATASDTEGVPTVDFDYGDGSGWTASTTHTYAGPGAYTITVRATDPRGAVTSTERVATILPPAAAGQAGTWDTLRAQALPSSLAVRPGSADVVQIGATGTAASSNAFWNGGQFTASTFVATSGTVMELDLMTPTSFRARYRIAAGTIQGSVTFTKR